MSKSKTVLFVLGVLAVAVAIRLLTLHRNAYVVTLRDDVSMDFRGLADVPLEEVSTGQRSSLESDAAHRLVIFLSAADCASCLDETKAWNLLAGDKDLAVVIVLVRTARNEIEAYRHGFNPQARILYDADDRLPSQCRLPKETPMKVLFDRNWRPVFAEGPGSWSSSPSFVAEIRRRTNA